jgi:MFS family permease
MGLYLYVPVLTPVVTHATGSAGVAGLVVASYGVPQLLSRLGLAIWSDRLGRKQPFIAGGLVLVAASAVGMVAAPSAAGFLAFRTMAGLAASTWAMFSIQYAAWQPGERVAAAMGRLSFANNGGQVLAALLGGLLAQTVGDSAPFWAAGLAGLMGLALVAGLGEPARHAPVEPGTPLRQTWRRAAAGPAVLLASLLGILLQATTFATTFGYLPLWAARHGVSSGGLGLLTAAALLPAAGASVVAGSWASRRWSAATILALGFVLVGIATGSTPWLGGGAGLFLAQLLAGAGRGLLTPTLMTLAVRDTEQRWRTSALATYQSLYAVGMIGGPAVAGALVGTWGLPHLFEAAGLTALLAAALASRLVPAATQHGSPERRLVENAVRG